jgi:predicted  nucleic acid-binding Zn-ribbon protein
MKPSVQKILTKLAKEEKQKELQKIDLSLAKADEIQKFISKNQLAEKELGKKIDAARIKLAQAVNEAKDLREEFDYAKRRLPVAIKELGEIRKTLRQSGISTGEVDKRESVLKTFANMANDISNKLSKLISGATNKIG